MSKLGIPSAAVSPSASASASSYDPHSLPPNVKGLVQRYLAVSLPTVTFAPELIEAIDKAGILIPSRIKVTMRWWKEDASSSLSVYPNLNSPLPPAIGVRQARLRQKNLGHNPQVLYKQREPPSPSDGAAALGPDQLRVHAQQKETRPQTRSAAAAAAVAATSFLKKPWAGARLLSAFRKGKKQEKQKANGNVATPSESIPQPPQVCRKPDHDPVDRKPLPMLPPAAFPLTVAYPVRCSLDHLHRYFQEMSLLALEIHITPDLVASTTVPNLVDLLHNINGTFSGVFTFTNIVRNNDAALAHEALFQSGTVLGMVVFQAWSQDTSQVSETSEGSDSASSASMPLAQHYRGSTSGLRRSHSRSYHQPSSLPRRLDLEQIHAGTRHDSSGLPHQTFLTRSPIEDRGKAVNQPSLHFGDHVQTMQSHRRDHSRSHFGNPASQTQSSVDQTRTTGHARLPDHNRTLGRHRKVTIPQPEVDHRDSTLQTSLDGSLPYEDRRRSQNMDSTSASKSQGSRSRPRSGATAAAIGRLDAVLSRGHDLLQGIMCLLYCSLMHKCMYCYYNFQRSAHMFL